MVWYDTCAHIQYACTVWELKGVGGEWYTMIRACTWKITYISTMNRCKKKEKQTIILHTQATYCTHKQQLHQLRNIVSHVHVHIMYGKRVRGGE